MNLEKLEQKRRVRLNAMVNIREGYNGAMKDYLSGTISWERVLQMRAALKRASMEWGEAWQYVQWAKRERIS
jgi:hypothetical protein